MRVRVSATSDRLIVEEFLADHGATRVARLGALVDAREHPALLAEGDGRLVGLLTFLIDGERCEILTLHAAEQWHGVGTALIEQG